MEIEFRNHFDDWLSGAGFWTLDLGLLEANFNFWFWFWDSQVHQLNRRRNAHPLNLPPKASIVKLDTKIERNSGKLQKETFGVAEIFPEKYNFSSSYSTAFPARDILSQ